MRLKHLIEAAGIDSDYCEISDFEVSGISCDSGSIRNNYIFVAIKGTHADGHKFIPEAIERGAKAIIVQRTEGHLPAGRQGEQRTERAYFIEVGNTRKALARLAVEFYGNPSKKIKVVGITGTNGKTTISYLIEAILERAGFIPAVIGTVNYRFRDKVIPAKNTTPGPLELQSLLADMVRKGSDYLVMEVSSHALDQNRTEGINFYAGIFTNLTQDHLDYHKTLENYFQAKSQLFKNMHQGSWAMVNNDDKYSRRIKDLTKATVITYGIDNPSDVAAEEIKFDIAHTEFSLKNKKEEIKIKTRFIGRHNVYNILAAATFALQEGISLETIKSALEGFSLVPGRLEKIDFRGDFSVFVDYAHTEDALKNVITTLRQLAKERIIVVFGCGGERDKTKRPKMGALVCELADYAVITNDNPRSEEPKEIIEDIKRGIKRDNYCVLPERAEAIKKSLSLACSGDIVLIAGKGHESYQILKDKIIPFDDREVVKRCLASLNY